MLEIIEIIKSNNSKMKLLDMENIKEIVNILTSYFDINIKRIVNRDNKYIMSLSLKDLELIVDYQKIKEFQDVRYANYIIIFGLIHELRHYFQFKEDDVIYNKCFEYVNSNSLFRIAFYARFHDYFPIEINADIVGLLYCLYIQIKLSDYEYYQMFKDKLYSLLNKLNTEQQRDVLISIMGDDYINYLNGRDEYNLFINGLLLDDEKVNEIIKRVLL